MEKQEQLIQIEKEIKCSHCDFKTKNGSEMYDHLFHNETMFFHDMQYAMSWKVGRANTYRWLCGNATDLVVSALPKCDHCRKPYIAYNGGDDCEDCRKLPEVQAYLKYSYNRADYEDVNHYTHICKRCGINSNSISQHREHGELKEVDGVLQHFCEPKN